MKNSTDTVNIKNLDIVELLSMPLEDFERLADTWSGQEQLTVANLIPDSDEAFGVADERFLILMCKSASQRYVPAMLHMGNFFYSSNEYERAVQLYEEAFGMGADENEDACLNYGDCLERGIGGLDANLQKAREMYQKALKIGGNPEAIYRLGRTYANELNNCDDSRKSILAATTYLLMDTAAKRGHPLALIYEKRGIAPITYAVHQNNQQV